MNWINKLTWVEYSFIGFFLLMYLIYFIKVWWVSRRLGTSSKAILIKFLIRFIYMVLLVAAILGPTIGETDRTTQAIGKDIYLAVDLSNSMNADDIQPSRLERSKFEIVNLLNQLDDYRVGLLVFSSEAFMLTPLTYDKSALQLFIQQLSTTILADNGTSFNSVLDLAAAKYAADENSDRFVRTLLIVTDGEDHGSLPDSTISALGNLRVNVLFWGVGTVEGSRVKNSSGGFLKNSSGEEIVSKLNISAINDYAKQLKGSVFKLNQTQNDVNVLLKAIAKLRNTTVDERKFMIENNRYYYLLWLALALIIIDIIFTVRTIRA